MRIRTIKLDHFKFGFFSGVYIRTKMEYRFYSFGIGYRAIYIAFTKKRKQKVEVKTIPNYAPKKFLMASMEGRLLKGSYFENRGPGRYLVCGVMSGKPIFLEEEK